MCTSMLHHILRSDAAPKPWGEGKRLIGVLYFFLPATPTVLPRRPVVLVCCPRTRMPQ